MSTSAWLPLLLAGEGQRARRHRYSHIRAAAPNWQERASRRDKVRNEPGPGGVTNRRDSQAEPTLQPAQVGRYSITVYRRLPVRVRRHITTPMARAHPPQGPMLFINFSRK